jgi:hypothetical protein
MAMVGTKLLCKHYISIHYAIHWQGTSSGNILCHDTLPPPPVKFQKHNFVLTYSMKEDAQTSMVNATKEPKTENKSNENIAAAFDGSGQK